VAELRVLDVFEVVVGEGSVKNEGDEVYLEGFEVVHFDDFEEGYVVVRVGVATDEVARLQFFERILFRIQIITWSLK